jgi:hypothetical protein
MDDEKHCTTCEFEAAQDRAACNACAREWNASGYTRYINWVPKSSSTENL